MSSLNEPLELLEGLLAANTVWDDEVSGEERIYWGSNEDNVNSITGLADYPFILLSIGNYEYRKHGQGDCDELIANGTLVVEFWRQAPVFVTSFKESMKDFLSFVGSVIDELMVQQNEGGKELEIVHCKMDVESLGRSSVISRDPDNIPSSDVWSVRFGISY